MKGEKICGGMERFVRSLVHLKWVQFPPFAVIKRQRVIDKMKTDLIVDMSGIGKGGWDMFLSILKDLPAPAGKVDESFREWFEARFNVIKFSATKQSMEMKMKEILK